jgi:pimeloyl-ACP methyl ester carboxylesterase
VADWLDPGPLLLPDDDLKPVPLSLDKGGDPLIGFTMQLTWEGPIEVWASEYKDPLATGVFPVDGFPAQVYVEGTGSGVAKVHWTLISPFGLQVHTDTVQFTVVNLDLTAYRPQTEGPGYGLPFPRTAVLEDVEESPGAGIRRNSDHDNGVPTMPDYEVNTVPQENDLIEVAVNLGSGPASGIAFALERSTADIAIWHYASKGNELPFVGNQAAVSQSASVWAEWVTPGTGAGGCDLTLGVWDTTHNRRVFTDIVHFYPFQSVVIAFGGRGSVPLNPDTGPFQMATTLYEGGYDVHAYNYSAWNGAAYNEVVRAVQNRSVTNVAIFGHSWGGGATYDLANALQGTIPAQSLRFTAYIDAIVTGAIGIPNVTPPPPPQTQIPPGSTYHVNYYETIGWPPGAACNPAANFDLNVNTTGWGAALDHNGIDNEEQHVRRRILNGSQAAAPEGPHDGLTQRVPR